MSTETILAVLLAGAAVGCSGLEEESEQWRKARESRLHQEWQATNGMAWPSVSLSPETVMVPGMEITARTTAGEISIRAGEGFERSYTWDGATRSIKLWPRKQRWYGALGIYYPGPGQHWKSNKGITRGVLEEGILWFKTVDDALSWIKGARSTGIDHVYTDDGLVIGWAKILPRKQLDVAVWQIMVDGKKPHSLPGSRNDVISVRQKQ